MQEGYAPIPTEVTEAVTAVSIRQSGATPPRGSASAVARLVLCIGLLSSIAFAVIGEYTAAFLAIGFVGLLAAHAVRRRDGGWTLVTVAIATNALCMGIANALLLRSDHRADDSVLALRYEPGLATAYALSLLSIMVPAIAAAVLPPSKGFLTRRGETGTLGTTPLYYALFFLVGAWMWRLGIGPARSLGLLSNFLSDGASIAILLIRLSALAAPNRRRKRRLNTGALSVVAFEVPYQLATSLLRADVLWLGIAWILPAIIEGRRPSRRQIAAISVGAVIVLSAFEPLGNERTTVRGSERFGLVAGAVINTTPETLVDGALELGDRMSTATQLSLLYMMRSSEEAGPPIDVATALVPRFLYPSKPLITPGEWFAEKLGRGQQTEDGFSNAINLTPAGHFFVSYGWAGATLGLALQFLLMRMIWRLTFGADRQFDVGDAAIGFLAFRHSFFIGSSGTVVFTLLSILLVALASEFFRRVRRGE